MKNETETVHVCTKGSPNFRVRNSASEKDAIISNKKTNHMSHMSCEAHPLHLSTQAPATRHTIGAHPKNPSVSGRWPLVPRVSFARRNDLEGPGMEPPEGSGLFVLKDPEHLRGESTLLFFPIFVFLVDFANISCRFATSRRFLKCSRSIRSCSTEGKTLPTPSGVSVINPTYHH